MLFAKTVALVMLLASGGAMAQPAIRVDCSAQYLDELNRLADPDREVFGLKAKDWRPKHVKQWQRQSLACIDAKPNWGEAMKDSMRQAVACRSITTRSSTA